MVARIRVRRLKDLLIVPDFSIAVVSRILRLCSFPLLLSGGVLSLIALGWGLLWAPEDWQQGDTVRIIYVHVPLAWLACIGFGIIGAAVLADLAVKSWLARLIATETCKLGLIASSLCLLTGMTWGYPIWGTWWVWDGRVTSMLILFCLYGIYYLLQYGRYPFFRPLSWFVVSCGVADLPVIRFSVNWWPSLHQRDTIAFFEPSSIEMSMLAPLLVSITGFSVLFAGLLSMRLSSILMRDEDVVLAEYQHHEQKV